MAELITVQLAFAETCDRQHYVTLQLTQGSTIFQALEQSGWLDQFSDLKSWCKLQLTTQTPSAKGWRVGVFSQKQPLSYELNAYDRIEVYRSLSADPMAQRKSKSQSRRKSLQ